MGTALTKRLRDLGMHPVTTDIADYAAQLDVTHLDSCKSWVETVKPEIIFHLAGAKYATDGEVNPVATTRVNVDGTRNIVAAANGAKVILASTCKAANPETVYGASKLIAERLVLNAGGTVVRFFNVPETVGNVFRLWEERDKRDEPIEWTDCWRYFVPLDKILDLLVRAMDLPSGRYAPDPGSPHHMQTMAKKLYPFSERKKIQLRRGDRRQEPLKGTAEVVFRLNGVLKIASIHD